MLDHKQILDILTAGTPVSIVRIGDGEGIVLNSQSSIEALCICNESVMYRQFGYFPTLNEIEEIRNNLIDAYNQADIIGIPNHSQKTNSHWEKVKGYLMENCPENKGVFSDVDIAYIMLKEGDFDTLMKDREVVNYISCRDIDEGLKRKWNIKVTNKFTLAPEKKFTSGYEGDKHYPDQFNKIPRWMEVQASNFPGSLLLVGAGVAGKIYCNWWRDMGGVAFDVGSVLDEWYGAVTRGPNRGLDIIIENGKGYKL